MTDMHSLAVYLHPLPTGASADSFAEGMKVLSRFKKSPVAGASLALVYGVDWQQRAYEEAMGRSWNKPFDPQFDYASQRSKADKNLLKEISGD